MQLDPGLYLNVFPVDLPKEAVEMFAAPRSNFQDLRALRTELEGKDTWVYAVDETVYGYGPGMQYLRSKGFQPTTVVLSESPKLASRLIMDGLVNLLMIHGYDAIPRGRGRWQLYHPDQFTELADGNVRVCRGYDLRSFFWRDLMEDTLMFGLVVDIKWMIRDGKNKPLSLQQAKQQYGGGIVNSIAEAQGELLPRIGKFNTEITRQRVTKQILPFVRTCAEFDLPCGGQASINMEPARVVIGGTER